MRCHGCVDVPSVKMKMFLCKFTEDCETNQTEYDTWFAEAINYNGGVYNEFKKHVALKINVFWRSERSGKIINIYDPVYINEI